MLPTLTCSAPDRSDTRRGCRSRRRVVASSRGDILIGEIEAFLREQKLGETGVAFLFDDAAASSPIRACRRS